LKYFKGQQESATAEHSIETNKTEYVATMHCNHLCMTWEPIEIIEKSERTSREKMVVYPAAPQ
jgi:hypothetical protein